MKKNILISGGSRGIGLEIARIFYKSGFEVLICARGAKSLDEAAVEMPGIHTYVCDISQKDEVKKLASEINASFGALDVLVNNGGTFLPGKLHEEDDSVFEQLIATNLSSAYYLTKGVLPPMMEKRSGSIFNIGSIASITAYDNGGSYAISKFALRGFSMALREEMKAFNIRVISILPGAVYTSSWEGVDLPESRFIPATDIASLVWNAYNMSERTVVEEILVRPREGDI